MIKNFTRASMLALVLTSLSCASIVHGPNQTIDFTSQPTGANITIDGTAYGQTPLAIPLKRKGRLPGEASEKQMYQVKIEMEGFHPYELKVKREVDGWFFGNLLFGGLIGIVVDAANGSMYKLTPDQVIAQMGKLSAANTSDKNQNIYIAVALQVDPNWEKVGQLQKK